MQEATIIIGGFIGGTWGLLVLFVAIRSFILSVEQKLSEH